MSYPTCEERIDAELESTLDCLRDLWELYHEDVEAYHEEHQTNMYEYGLSFDYVAPHTFTDQPKGYFRYQLSWGGPSDEFRFYTDLEFVPYEIKYHFMDWFDGAFRYLRGEDYDLLLEIFDWFKDCGTVEYVFNQSKE